MEDTFAVDGWQGSSGSNATDGGVVDEALLTDHSAPSVWLGS